MNTLEQQVSLLNGKVDVLYEILQETNLKLSEVLSQKSATEPTETVIPQLEEPINRIAFSSPSQALSQLEHKDVLLDDSYTEANIMLHHEEPNITADIQIQRLTAQLTAAYNRIAALEERLLSQRSPTIS